MAFSEQLLQWSADQFATYNYTIVSNITETAENLSPKMAHTVQTMLGLGDVVIFLVGAMMVFFVFTRLVGDFSFFTNRSKSKRKQISIHQKILIYLGLARVEKK